MDQNRPLTPQEREWQREKSFQPGDDGDNVTLPKLPADPALRRQPYGQNGNGGPTSPAPSYEQTSPALPQDIVQQLKNKQRQAENTAWPVPPAELEWHREKQIPVNSQPDQGQTLDMKPTRRLEDDAMPTRRLDPDSMPTRLLSDEPDARPTRLLKEEPDDVPTRQFSQADAMPTRQLSAEPDAKPSRRLDAAPDAMPTRQLSAETGAMPTRQLSNAPDVRPTRQLSAEQEKWQREKQLPPTPPAPPPAFTPNITQPPPALTPEEQQWQQEKQNYQTLKPQEIEWQREKLAYTDPSSEEIEWQREKQNYPTGQITPPPLSPQEFEWQREKQTYPTKALTPAALTSEELEWQREKQNYGALSAQELEWQREKQAYGTVSPQELEWQREKQAYPALAPVANGRPYTSIVPVGYQPTAIAPHIPAYPVKANQLDSKKKRRLWWLLIPLLLLILIGLVVAGFLLWPSNPPTDVVAATVVPGSTATAGSGGNALDPVQATINAQARATQTAGSIRDQNQELFNQGKSAYDNRKWADSIGFFEKIPTGSGTYTTAKPLLATAYFNQANDLALKETTAESLTQAVSLYDKATKLVPDNASFQTAGDNAKAYQAGQKASGNGNWETAVNQLGKIYQANPDFRDTVQLYYAALVSRGDNLSKAKRYQDARDMYSKALSLTFKSDAPDQTELKTKLADMETKSQPTPTAASSTATAVAPTVTPVAPTATAVPATATAVPIVAPPTVTPRPQPTPTPTKKVVVAAPAPCDKGGSGSNFFAFRTGQPQVPNVADQGRSGVRGVVLSKGGAALAGATVRISNGSYTFTSVTDGGGNYFREGLGRGIWTISVVGAPGRIMCYGAAGSANLSGQSGFYVTVDFTESVP